MECYKKAVTESDRFLQRKMVHSGILQSGKENGHCRNHSSVQIKKLFYKGTYCSRFNLKPMYASMYLSVKFVVIVSLSKTFVNEENTTYYH